MVLAGSTFAEKAGSYVNADGRIQYSEAALPPREEGADEVRAAADDEEPAPQEDGELGREGRHEQGEEAGQRQQHAQGDEDGPDAADFFGRGEGRGGHGTDLRWGE